MLLVGFFGSQSFMGALTAVKRSHASVGSGHMFSTGFFLKAQVTTALNPYDSEV